MFALILNPDNLAPMWLLPGGGELWLIGILVLILFGAPKIPEFFRSLGQGVGELKKGLKEGGEPSADKETQEEAKSDNS